jgi:hypothetical protein
MAATGKRWITLEAVVRQCQALEIKLNEAKAELDELDLKHWRAEVELTRLSQNGLWGWLVAVTRKGTKATKGIDLYPKPPLPRFGFQQK